MTEVVECSFCKSNDYTIFDTSDNWKIVKCNNCGFIFTNPRPTLESLPKYYEEEYFKDERHIKKFYHTNGEVKIDGNDYFGRTQEIENFVTKRGELLEIGAARGEFLKKMKDRGWQVSGVEISQDAVKLAKSVYNLDIFCGTFDQFKPQKQFDVICMYQTLEHVPNPDFIIDRSYELLKKDGILVIEVPNIKAFDIKIDNERKRLSYDLPRHLNHFHPSFLSKEIKKRKFEILDIDLHYPSFILKLGEALSKKKNKINTSQSSNLNLVNQSLTLNNVQEKPLLKRKENWKINSLKSVSKAFPGWRFTLIARKK